MNQTAVIQAAMVALRVFLIAGVTALSLNAADIVQIGTDGDAVTTQLVLPIVAAILSAIVKLIGGPTQQAPKGTVVGRGLNEGNPPSILSV